MSTRFVGPRPAEARLRPWWGVGVPLVPSVLLVMVVLGGCATGHSRGSPLSGSGLHDMEGGAGGFPGQTADAEARPLGWPHLSSSQEVLAPFLACTSPAEFIELQRGVDMPRLVEGLEDWSAVRLGSQGPLRAGAEVLNRKRC